MITAKIWPNAFLESRGHPEEAAFVDPMATVAAIAIATAAAATTHTHTLRFNGHFSR